MWLMRQTALVYIFSPPFPATVQLHKHFVRFLFSNYTFLPLPLPPPPSPSPSSLYAACDYIKVAQCQDLFSCCHYIQGDYITVIATLLSLSLSQIAFAAADSVTGLKLIEAGLPKEKIALLALPIVPLQIILPLIIR